jgi:hypothetical protein
VNNYNTIFAKLQLSLPKFPFCGEGVPAFAGGVVENHLAKQIIFIMFYPLPLPRPPTVSTPSARRGIY